MKRVFVIVLDAFGIGALPDAAEFGDVGSHTLRSCTGSVKLQIPNLKKLGLFNIDGVGCGEKEPQPTGSFGRFAERSRGKDTTVGHWELMGEITEAPFPTYPHGFPKEILDALENETGRKILCNLPYSGTKVLEDYGREQMETGGLIVYTSADSVFQIAAHEEVVSIEELYRICEKARGLLSGKHGVARVIARPFVGDYPNFTRTKGRHDYSLTPSHDTVLDAVLKSGQEVIGVGKIYDIFAGKGIGRTVKTAGNTDGIRKTLALMDENFTGLCFVNLVDTDMLYGHRNDVDGFAGALTEFDGAIPKMQEKLHGDDMLIITADHGCDPGTPSTDHSREYIPGLIFGKGLLSGINLGTGSSFSDIGATVLEALGITVPQNSFYQKIIRR
ncbi:MAG: phosphopentomutase [Oscillospiraceae bacterium]